MDDSIMDSEPSPGSGSVVVDLAEKYNIKELKQYVQSSDIKVLHAEIDSIIAQPTLIKYIDALFKHIRCDEEWWHKRKTNLVIFLLTRFQQQDANMTHSQDAFFYIHQYIVANIFPAKQMLAIFRVLINGIKHENATDSGWRNLVPGIVNRLQTHTQIEYGNEMLAGQVVHGKLLDTIFGLEWSLDKLVMLADMYSRISVLSKAESYRVMKRFTSKFNEMEVQCVPPLVFHLLQIKEPTPLLYLEIARYYTALNYAKVQMGPDRLAANPAHAAVPANQRHDAESNVVCHIRTYIFSDQSRAYLKYLRNASNMPEIVLNPFNVSLLLQLNRRILYDNLFELLHVAIQRYFIEDDMLERSFIRENVMHRTSIGEVFGAIIENGIENDRVCLLDILQEFAIHLLRTPAKQACAEQLQCLGRRIILKLMSGCDALAANVLEDLGKEFAMGSNVQPIMETYGAFKKHFGYYFVQSIDTVLKLYPSFITASAHAVEAYLDSVLTQVRLKPFIPEYILDKINATRRSSQTGARVNVAIGHLKLLQHLHVTNMRALEETRQASQRSFSLSTQMASRGRGGTVVRFSNEVICLESIGMLQRCFTMPLEVRLQLYERLPGVVTANPALSPTLLDMVLRPLQSCFVGDALCLERIGRIADGGDKTYRVTDSLARMVLCYGMMLANAELAFARDGERPYELDTHRTVLNDINDLLVENGVRLLKEFAPLDANDDSATIQRGLHRVDEILHVTEALAGQQMRIWFGNADADAGKKFLRLFEVYEDILDWMKVQETKRKKKNEPAVKKIKFQRSPTILPLECIQLYVVISSKEDSDPESSESINNKLNSMPAFHQYVLRTVQEAAKKIKRDLEFMSPDERDRSRPLLQVIINDIFDGYIVKHQKMIEFDSKTAILALEVFHELFATVSALTEEYKIVELNFMNMKKTQFEIDHALKYLTVYQRLFDETEPSDDAETTLIMSAIVNTIGLLSRLFSPDHGNAYTQLMNWMQKALAEKTIRNKETIAAFVENVVVLNERFTPTLKLHHKVVTGMGSIAGWASKDNLPTDDDGSRLVLINGISVPRLMLVLQASVKEHSKEIDCILRRVRIEYNYFRVLKGSDCADELGEVRRIESNVCALLVDSTVLMALLSDITMKPGVQTECVFKTSIRFFTTLSTTAKYISVMALHDVSRAKELLCTKFGAVIKNVFVRLVPALQNLIGEVQQTACQKKKGAKEAKKSATAVCNALYKEVQSVPTLTGKLEMFKSNVTLLTKKTRTEHLFRMGLATVRGFRVKNLTQVVRHNQRMNPTNDDEENAEEDSDVVEVDIEEPPVDEEMMISDNENEVEAEETQASVNDRPLQIWTDEACAVWRNECRTVVLPQIIDIKERASTVDGDARSGGWSSRSDATWRSARSGTSNQADDDERSVHSSRRNGSSSSVEEVRSRSSRRTFAEESQSDDDVAVTAAEVVSDSDPPAADDSERATFEESTAESDRAIVADSEGTSVENSEGTSVENAEQTSVENSEDVTADVSQNVTVGDSERTTIEDSDMTTVEDSEPAQPVCDLELLSRMYEDFGEYSEAVDKGEAPALMPIPPKKRSFGDAVNENEDNQRAKEAKKAKKQEAPPELPVKQKKKKKKKSKTFDSDEENEGA